MRRGEGDIVRRRISSSPLPFSQSSSFKRKLRGNKVKNCPLRLRTYLADRLNQMINQRPRPSKCFFISSERKKIIRVATKWNVRAETSQKKRNEEERRKCRVCVRVFERYTRRPWKHNLATCLSSSPPANRLSLESFSPLLSLSFIPSTTISPLDSSRRRWITSKPLTAV